MIQKYIEYDGEIPGVGKKKLKGDEEFVFGFNLGLNYLKVSKM